MATSTEIYGIVAEFLTAEELLAAARKVGIAGYRKADAFSPFPIHGVPEALGQPKTRVPLITLVGGLTGATFGYFMLWYANTVAYPWNVGGRPMNSWEAFIPITFELGVLGASLASVFGMFILNGLPMPYHPMFNHPNFELASQERFFLVIETRDPKFDPIQTRQFLEALKPASVLEVAK